jgi:hypothetical protein
MCCVVDHTHLVLVTPEIILLPASAGRHDKTNSEIVKEFTKRKVDAVLAFTLHCLGHKWKEDILDPLEREGMEEEFKVALASRWL